MPISPSPPAPAASALPRVDRIRAALAPLAPESVELVDDSARHRGHAGARDGGGHFRLEIVASCFAGRSRIERHRLVYSALSDLMQREIHALSLVLRAPGE